MVFFRKTLLITILTILLCSPSHAEVADKLPSLPELFVCYAAISILNFICLIKKAKLSYLVLPLTGIYAYICMTEDFTKENFHRIISTEMGAFYAYFKWYGLPTLLLISVIGALLWIKTRNLTNKSK